MSDDLTPPLKWHGGKHDLAKWIIGLMPPRCVSPNKPDPADAGWLHYVEPYFGGGSVLLQHDPEGISEVANDLNYDLLNFWSVLRCEKLFGSFVRKIQATEFGEELFRSSQAYQFSKAKTLDRPVDAAFWFFIRCRQSLAGRMDSFASISRNRTRRGMNEQVSAWLNCIEGLPAVHARLKRVLILNSPALDVIRREDGPRTLFYLDPPYLHETRATTGEYEHEMTEEQHVDLCTVIRQCNGKVLLSGYPSKLYTNQLEEHGWHRHDTEINNHAAGGKTKRRMTECVWTNFEPSTKGSKS